MKYINDGRLVIKSWCNNPEDGCVKQAINLANLPFVRRHVALMPDTHQGYGMPIGGVIATSGVVIPNAVGVDIGCGMLAVKTSLHKDNLPVELLKKVMGRIRGRVPVGFNHRRDSCDDTEMPGLPIGGSVCREQYEAARKQLGTLGGGNHFIEIQKDPDGLIWVMIHSGSRNLGKKVADYYNEIAKKMNKKWHTSVPESVELAFLPVDTQEGKDYMAEMKYCLEFSKLNRAKMLEDIIQVFRDETPASFYVPIDIQHNYAAWENHYGENVVVHRKGATSARAGQLGIIPGSQGSCSYIVEGLGNPDSFMSCSHGAGRRMGRKEAERKLNLEEEIKSMDDKGIVHGIRNKSDLDEAAGAYKDIDTVMEEQKDLVKIVKRLEPIGVIKG